MPLVYQQNINDTTKLGVWKIEEPEAFFLAHVPLQREITHPNKRLQHLAGRYLLKELFPGFPYGLIRIADTKKPFLENAAYHFSISHSGKYAAVMVSTGCRVGVDVEMVSEKINRVKHKFLSAAEQEILGNVGGLPDMEHVLIAAWSIKESLYKWKGSSEVDFVRHLHIDRAVVAGGAGIAACSITKDSPSELDAHFFFMQGNCISWVCSEIN